HGFIIQALVSFLIATSELRAQEIHAEIVPLISHAQRHSINAISFTSDGGLLATGGGDGTVKLWEVTTGRLGRTFVGTSRSIDRIAFSGRKFIAAGDQGGTVSVWNMMTGQRINNFTLGTGGVEAIAINDQYVAAASTDPIINVSSLRTGALLKLSGHDSGLK